MSEKKLGRKFNEYKKQRKYFRMGDFVVLKDGACLETSAVFGDITHGNTGVVCGMERDGSVKVHFTTAGGYDFDRVYPEALRLATKEERKALRKHKVAKITYDDVGEEEVGEAIPAEYDVKVGDIVEITKYVDGYPVGTIGEVTLVKGDSQGFYNRVRVRGNDGDWWNERDVKLVYRKENDGDNA